MNVPEVLRMNGIAVQRRQGLPVYQAVSSALYDDDSCLKVVADRMISDWRHVKSQIVGTAGASAQHSEMQINGSRQETESSWRRVDAAERRFQESQKYSGILGESPMLTEDRHAYLTYCDQKDFPRSDRVKLISCILKGPALNYWTLNLEQNPEYTELGAVFSKLESQFDTPAHQRQVEAMAQNLSMDLTRKKHTCSRVAALGILYHEVARLNQQFPKEKRGPTFQTQTLMRIVENCEWSRTSEEEVMRNQLSYDELYTKLSASLVVWEKEVARTGNDPNTADDSRQPKFRTAFIGYGSQYAYPGNTTPRDRSSTTYRTPSTYPRSRRVRSQGTRSRPSPRQSRSRCFKCGKLGHFRRDCREREDVSILHIVHSRIREHDDDPNATAASILFELVFEEDDYSLCSSTTLDEDLAVDNVFEALANSRETVQSNETTENAPDTPNTDDTPLQEYSEHFQNPDRQ